MKLSILSQRICEKIVVFAKITFQGFSIWRKKQASVLDITQKEDTWTF